MSQLQESQLVSEVAHSYAQPVSFGKNIRRLRLDREMRAKELAERMGVRQGTLSDWERDRRGLPETPTLIKFAKALDCSIDELLVGVDPTYDQMVVGRRDLSRHTDQESSGAAQSQAQRKGTTHDGGAATARVLEHQLGRRKAFVTDVKNVADLLREVIIAEERRLAREAETTPAQPARRGRHHRKAG